jgi:DNA-binding XRE family transcriptional regulator
MRNADAKHLFGILNCPNPLIFKCLRGPYTQAELAKALEIREQNVREWESGRGKPAPGHMRALLAHFRDWTRELQWPAMEILIAASTGTRRTKTEGKP